MSDNITRRHFFAQFFKGLFYFVPSITFFKKQVIFKTKLWITSWFFSLLIPLRDKDVVFMEKEDKIIFHDKNQKYEMNETASFIWKNCTGDKSLRKISKEVSKEFGISQTDAFRDTTFFVRKLKRLGYLKYV